MLELEQPPRQAPRKLVDKAVQPQERNRLEVEEVIEEQEQKIVNERRGEPVR